MGALLPFLQVAAEHAESVGKHSIPYPTQIAESSTLQVNGKKGRIELLTVELSKSGACYRPHAFVEDKQQHHDTSAGMNKYTAAHS